MPRQTSKTAISLKQKQSKGKSPQPFGFGVPGGEGAPGSWKVGNPERTRISLVRSVRPPAELLLGARRFLARNRWPRPGICAGRSPRLSRSAAAAATPHSYPLESAPLPTASNHYSAWSALNMQKRVTSCESRSIRREGAKIYINVAWAGREGLKGWRRERWARVYSLGERSSRWQYRAKSLSEVVNLFGSPSPRPFPQGTGEHWELSAPQLLRSQRGLGPRRLAMFPWGLSSLSVLGAAGTALLCAGLLLSLAQHLWTLRWTLSRDRSSALPLPKGSMGWPFFGETLHWLVQGSRFHSSRRERYGTVFKTHLLGRPVIRVSGAENVRTILLGEHRLVRSQWPQSAHILLGSHTLLGAVGEPHRQRRKILARVFSRAALERYVPRLQGALRREVRSWCVARGPVAVYEAAKALTFRMAARILLGLRLEEEQCSELARTFERFVENLFSLPLDVPFSGLRKVLPAPPQAFPLELP
uniref:Cytochrome P450 26C1 n=1 Tax=Sus scrofa TaxID=9823 RepID=A0A480TS08_PIG